MSLLMVLACVLGHFVAILSQSGLRASGGDANGSEDWLVCFSSTGLWSLDVLGINTPSQWD